MIDILSVRIVNSSGGLPVRRRLSLSSFLALIASSDLLPLLPTPPASSAAGHAGHRFPVCVSGTG
eukprot:752161-Hanusia_phi.AAC.1